MNWRIPKWAYLADLFAVPAVVVATLSCVAAQRGLPPLPAWKFLPLGWLAWILLEYGLHRFVFHTLYRREHGEHHARPRDWIGIAPWITLPLLLALAFIATRLVGVDRGLLFAVGFALGYVTYCYVHIGIHHREGGFLAGLRAAHTLHHGGAKCNYGVSTTLVDRLLGTYVRPDKARAAVRVP